MNNSQQIIDRLKKLLPELEYARETHRQWSECPQEFRDKNPDSGDAEFHSKYVGIYNERISAIEEAVNYLQSQPCTHE